MSIEIWWLGQAGFRLRDPATGTTVFVDPYLLQREDRSWQAPVQPEALADADAVLVSHEHTDHLDRPSIKTAAGVPDARFKVVVPRPIVDEVTALGVPRDRVIDVQPGQTIEIGSLRVTPVPARHGVNVSDAYTLGEQISDGLVRYLGYVIETDGARVYHAGDCIPFDGQADLLRSLAPDIALLPINGRDYYRETDRNTVGNMDDREAARLAHDMGASVLIPMHWELFARNRGYPDRLVAYANQFFPELTVLVPGQGMRVLYQRPD